MPYYEFECNCGKVTEELVKMGTDTIHCPACGHEAHKIMSRCSFSLKGGGWYADGYASKGSGGSNSTSTSGTAAETKTPAKTESKKETSTPAKSE
ncbi:MAG: FmdB family zinc ribbon protein [Thermodesulfobacteriota bacterium]